MEITLTAYYTVILPSIIVGSLVLYGVIGFLWNKYLVPAKQLKGKKGKKFGATVKENLNIALKEDDFTLLPKAKSRRLKSLASLKMLNIILLFLTVIMLGIYPGLLGSDIKFDARFAFVPFLMFLLLVWVRSAPIKSKREQILDKMFVIANGAFKYPRGAELTPWTNIQVQEWSGAAPKQLVVNFPVSFDASGFGSRDGFERHFNASITEDNSWSYDWDTIKSRVTIKAVKHIPSMAPYEGSEQYPWHVIPLGEGLDGPVSVDLNNSPHFLITGTTGSGKSVLQRNLIFHAIQHNDMMRFLGIDLKRVELGAFRKYEQTVLGIGTTLEDAVEILRYVQKVMENRYERMEQAGVNHFKDMIDPETGKPDYAIMLMVDEAGELLSPEGTKTDEGKMRDQLHGDAMTILGSLARLGRAAGIHLVIATQRPDAKIIAGEFKNNLSARVLAGRSGSIASSMTLDSGSGMNLPPIKGRGILSVYGVEQQFQGYYADQDWIDGWLQNNPGREPTLFPAIEGSEDFLHDLEGFADEVDLDDGTGWSEDNEPQPDSDPREFSEELTNSADLEDANETSNTDKTSESEEPRESDTAGEIVGNVADQDLVDMATSLQAEPAQQNESSAEGSQAVGQPVPTEQELADSDSDTLGTGVEDEEELSDEDSFKIQRLFEMFVLGNKTPDEVSPDNTSAEETSVTSEMLAEESHPPAENLAESVETNEDTETIPSTLPEVSSEPVGLKPLPSLPKLPGLPSKPTEDTNVVPREENNDGVTQESEPASPTPLPKLNNLPRVAPLPNQPAQKPTSSEPAGLKPLPPLPKLPPRN